MKDAMQVLDFDDPCSEPLKAVLMQCFVTPIILKSDQVIITVTGFWSGYVIQCISKSI